MIKRRKDGSRYITRRKKNSSRRNGKLLQNGILPIIRPKQDRGVAWMKREVMEAKKGVKEGEKKWLAREEEGNGVMEGKKGEEEMKRGDEKMKREDEEMKKEDVNKHHSRKKDPKADGGKKKACVGGKHKRSSKRHNKVKTLLSVTTI